MSRIRQHQPFLRPGCDPSYTFWNATLYTNRDISFTVISSILFTEDFNYSFQLYIYIHFIFSLKIVINIYDYTCEWNIREGNRFKLKYHYFVTWMIVNKWIYFFLFLFLFLTNIDDAQITLHWKSLIQVFAIHNRLSPSIVKFCDRKSSCTSSSKNNNIFASYRIASYRWILTRFNINIVYRLYILHYR